MSKKRIATYMLVLVCTVAMAGSSFAAEKREYSVVAEVLAIVDYPNLPDGWNSSWKDRTRLWHVLLPDWFGGGPGYIIIRDRLKATKTISLEWVWPGGEVAKYHLVIPSWPLMAEWYEAQDAIDLRFVVTEQGEYDDCKIYLPFASEEIRYVQFYHYNYGWPEEPATEEQDAAETTEEQIAAITTEDKVSAIYQKVVEDPKGGISMTMLIVGLVLGFGICVGFGFIKGGYRLVPRKGGGFIGERVPALSVKVVRNNLDDEKE